MDLFDYSFETSKTISSLDESKEIQLDMSIHRFTDYNDHYLVSGNGFSSYSATIDSYNPMDGDTFFSFHSDTWRIDSEGVRETIRSNFIHSDIQEKVDILVEE